MPGVAYDIGYITNKAQLRQYDSVPPPAQNGITTTGYVVYNNYAAATPNFAGGGPGAHFGLRLINNVSTPVPTVSERAMILLGMNLGGGAVSTSSAPTDFGLIEADAFVPNFRG